jgi:AraC-like DNA-binding protein
MEAGEWDFHKMCWVVVGRGLLETSDKSVSIESGDFILLPQGCRHRFVDDTAEPLTLNILCVHPEAFDGGNLSIGKDDYWDCLIRQLPVGQALNARTRFHYNQLVELFRMALREQEKAILGWELALKQAANMLLLRFVRGDVAMKKDRIVCLEDEIEGALAYMELYFRESLQIQQMAENCGMSPRRFTELFKRKTGQTFTSWLVQRRVEFACQRLRESGHILYACHESGFNDPAYFYRVFKSVTGMTPGAYIEATWQGSETSDMLK